MDQWKDFAVSVALPGNGALPAANNDLTMGHIAALGPLLVILLYVRRFNSSTLQERVVCVLRASSSNVEPQGPHSTCVSLSPFHIS